VSKSQWLIEILKLIEEKSDKWMSGMLSPKFHISRMQISRDLTALDEMGYIIKSSKTTISINEKKKV